MIDSSSDTVVEAAAADDTGEITAEFVWFGSFDPRESRQMGLTDPLMMRRKRLRLIGLHVYGCESLIAYSSES